MAKISAKKSNLKTIANKIIVSPSTDVVADLKFKRRKDFSTFVKWIDSSNKALDRIKLPSKKEVEKLGKGTGGSNWLVGLLGLLGLGAALAAKGKDKDKGDSDTGSGVTAEDSGGNIPSILEGPNLTSALDITRQLNDKNIRTNNKINRNNKKIDIKNKKTLQKNLKNAKVKSNWIKNLRSGTLRNKFWKKGGTKPIVTSLGKGIRRVQFKHGSKWMKVGQGTTFGATKAKAPLVPDPLSKGMLQKQPTLKTSFGKNIKNLFKPGNLKNLGKGFLAGWIGDQATGLINTQIDKAGDWGSRKIIDHNIKKHGVHKVLAHNVKLRDEFASKKKEGFLTDWGTNDFNKKMLDKFQHNINYIESKYKDQLNNQSKNIFQKTDETTIPFPIITTDISEKFNLPTIDMKSFNPYTSSSSDSSFPLLNSDDNPFSDLLLNSLK